ncbi:MAG: CynX/NimT family MFS transporter [Hyphomicrobiales bacterium]
MDRRWIILCVLFLARTAMGFQFESIASVAPLLPASLSINYAEIGLLIGLYFLPGALISLPGGLFIQRFGDKTICAVGLCLMVGGGLLLGVSGNFATAFAGRLVSGTGAILFNQVITKMATDWFAGREIVFAMGVILASWPFGIAAGLIIQPWLGMNFGWPAVMHMAAALCALGLILVMLAYRSPPTKKAAAPGHPAPAPSLALPPGEQILPLTIAGAIWGGANIGLVLFFSFTPQLLQEFGFSPVASASLPSTALWIIMVSVPLGGYLIERRGKADGAIMLCCGLSGLILVLLSIGLWPPLLCAGFGAVMGLPAGAIMALPARILRPADRAAGLGVFFTCYYALMAVGPALAGWLQDHWHTAAAALLLAAALFLVITPLLLLFNRLSGEPRPAAASLP